MDAWSPTIGKDSASDRLAHRPRTGSRNKYRGDVVPNDLHHRAFKKERREGLVFQNPTGMDRGVRIVAARARICAQATTKSRPDFGIQIRKSMPTVLSSQSATNLIFCRGKRAGAQRGNYARGA